MTNQPNVRFNITVARIRHGVRCIYIYEKLNLEDGMVESVSDRASRKVEFRFAQHGADMYVHEQFSKLFVAFPFSMTWLGDLSCDF